DFIYKRFIHHTLLSLFVFITLKTVGFSEVFSNAYCLSTAAAGFRRRNGDGRENSVSFANQFCKKVDDFQFLLLLTKSLLVVSEERSRNLTVSEIPLCWNRLVQLKLFLKKHSFCWWAVDIVATSKNPELYYNGDSPMIENNINRVCNAEKHSRYGISYVDVLLSRRGIIDILAEVSYYCCKDCTRFENYTKEKKIEDLLDHYYEKRLEPLLDTDRYCFNIDGEKEKNIVDDAPCILIFNMNSEMKIYTGSMLWNQIDQTMYKISGYFISGNLFLINNSLTSLFFIDNGCNNISTIEKDVKCWQVPSEYFVFCCCWNNPLNCTYSPNTELITEKNKKIWLKLAKTRNPKSTLEMESIIFGNRLIDWPYRDFIYSLPSGNILNSVQFNHLSAESEGTYTIPGLNEPRYHCLQVYFSADRMSSYDWIIIKPEKIQSRYRFCKVATTVSFKNNTRQ
ncbi:hypothetical protein X798_01040, partial [Onchocerca flexuosa]